ncbi:MAG: AI-2E family transporter [Chitinophagaceae bacterium]
MQNQRDNNIGRYFFLAIILIFAFFLLMSVIQFFTAFLTAVIFYILSGRFTDWLVKKKKWKKGAAAIIIIIISFFVILLPITVLVSLLYNRIISLVAHPEDIINGVKHFDSVIQANLGFQVISDQTIASARTFATSLIPIILNQGLSFFTTILMMYFFLYFMIVNRNRMEAGIIFYLPFRKDKINMFGKELVAQTFSNAVGIPSIAIIQGVFAFTCYKIVGVPQAGFWGVITCFTSVIPIVGSGIVWVPMSIYLFAIGHTWQAIFVIAWSAIIVGLIDNVVRFVLAKRMADVHPIITVLGVILGLKIFGFIGLIFGPLLISYFLILLKIYYTEYQRPLTPLTAKPIRKRQLMPTYMQPFLGFKPTIKKKK